LSCSKNNQNMKSKLCLLAVSVLFAINIFGQTKTYDIIDSTTNTIIDVYYIAMDMVYDDVINDDFFTIYAGVEWKQFIKDKYRLDLGLHVGISPVNYEDENYKKVVDWHVRPKANARINIPLIYKTNIKPIKVKTAAKNNSSYTTVWYKELPTIHRHYFNLHGGVSSGAFDRKLKGGINYTHVAFANVNMGTRNKKILSYFDFGIEVVYEFDQSGYITQLYELEGKEINKIGLNSYMSYSPNFAENAKIVMDLGYCHGVTFNFGGIIGIPILKK